MRTVNLVLAMFVCACSGSGNGSNDAADGMDALDAGDGDAGAEPEAGQLAWAVRAGGPQYDFAAGIDAAEDGWSVIAGGFQGSIVFGPGEPNQTELTSDGRGDVFLARYRQDGTLDWARHIRDGTLAWVKTITGASSEHGHVISALPDGSALVAGWIKGAATFGTGEAGQTLVRPVGATDMFVARYHPDGTFAWVRHAGGTGNVSARGLSALEDGTALAMGAFSDTAVFGSGEINETAFTSVGDHDLFVVRLEP